MTDDRPGDFYQPIIARMFGTARHAMFPVASSRDVGNKVLTLTGMDTLELVSRLQRSDLDEATLNALRVMADNLCSEYASMPADQLLDDGRTWLRKITQAQDQRLTLRQHRETLVLAGWVTLLIACVEYDTDFDGTERAPMRTAEARITLGVVAARQGDIEQAVHQGEQALAGLRKSIPSLAMVSRDLTRVLKERYPREPATATYLDRLQTVVGGADLARRRRLPR